MSFHIASQSVANPRLGLTINFKQNDSDTSKVLLEIVSSGVTDLDEDGNPDAEERPAHTLTLCFNRGGLLLWQKVTDPEGNDHHQAVPLSQIRDPSGAEGTVNTTHTLANPGNNPYAMVHQPVTDRTRARPNEGQPNPENRDMRDGSGRNPTADNPYTYQAPIDPDALQRGDTNVGGVQPYPMPEGKQADAPPDPHEVRKTSMEAAAKAAEEAKAKRESNEASNVPGPKPAPPEGEPEPDDPFSKPATLFSAPPEEGYEVGKAPPKADGKPVKPAPEPV